jgi:hypothetical protein
MSYDGVEPFGLLRRLRDGEITTRNDLVSMVTNVTSPGEDIVERLQQDGFVSGAGTADSPFTLNPLVARLFRALRVSLNELATYSHRSIVFNPVFGSLHNYARGVRMMQLRPSSDKNEFAKLDGFVLMPFASEMKPVYDDHIRAVADRMRLRVARADDFFGTTPIMGDVWTAINGCKFAIADCTGRNPNVFYELGIAHTLGKPVVLMTQNMDDVPFDLQQFRVIVYEFTPRGMKALEMQLERTIASILDPVGTLLSDLALDSAKAFVEPDKEH